MKTWRSAMAAAILLAMGIAAFAGPDKPAIDQDVKQGELRVQMKDGSIVSCPLKHTDVKANVSGFIARVKVTQTFYNPLDEKIEAVYVFPLPHAAAVDDMTMVIGDRRIVGIIKRREAARAIYEQALAMGQTAALLEQERPNIFTQSVGNIKPKQEVLIEISYVDVLKYDVGVYEFHFPMVVGPRYIPGGAASKVPDVPAELQGKTGTVEGPKEGPEPKGQGWAPDTDRVPDASRITPPVMKPGFRNGHDIGLALELDAGVPIQDLKVTQHNASIRREGKSKATIKLDPADSIPNKDFVLRYGVVGEKPELAVLAHARAAGGGYFMLMAQPKEDERLTKSPPRELYFLVDVSGSMSGQPIGKVKEAMRKFLSLSKEGDTFQVIKFAGSAAEVFEKPQAIDDASLTKAMNAVDQMEGGGGTEMLKGIVKCLDVPADSKRVRIVIMMTDGFIGNEKEIIGEVGRRCGDRIRFWTIGIGSSPNRFLLDGVAKQGGGMSKTLGLNDNSEPLVQEVMFRIHRAQLANVKVDWAGLDVYETYPAKVPELWAGRPVILFGRYTKGGEATIKVSGSVEGEAASFPVKVSLPGDEPANGVLAQVWARKKIEELTAQDAIEPSPAVAEAVTQIALDYRLMSQYTSFVAVDKSEEGKLTEPARPPRRMLVPVPMPEGVSFAGVFGPQGEGEVVKGMDMLEKADAVVMPSGALGPVMHSRAMSPPAFSVARSSSGKALSSPMPPAAPPPAVVNGKAGYSQAQDWTPAAELAARKLPKGLAMLAYLGAGGDEAVKMDVKEALDYTGASTSRAYTTNVLRDEAAKYVETAKKALDAGKELAKKGDAAAAQAQFQLAYLLDAAAMTYRFSNGETAATALTEIGNLTKDVKALDKRINLLIRNQSLEAAIASLSMATDLKLTLLAGSAEDAKALLNADKLTVTYLDLRGATVREALNWLLSPLRLSWTAKGDEVVIGSARQMGGPWVYDAALLALPNNKDFEGKDWQAQMKAAKEAADEFLAAVRTASASAVWYAPGQVLVFGGRAEHEAAARLLANLADPKSKLDGAAEKVHGATAARYAARKEAYAKWRAAVAKARVARAMAEHSWGLYAAALKAALNGDFDLEDLTELQAAWGNPLCGELLKDGSFAAIRSVWLIAESARLLALNQDEELGRPVDELLKLALGASAEARRKALADAAGKDDPTAFVKALYSAMAAGGAPDAFLTTMKDKDPLAAFRVLARALLLPVKDADVKAVQGLLGENLRGDDLVVLGALAARRVGGDTWDLFRANARDILGKQALSGDVIVLVSRLASVPATTVAKK